MNEPWQCTSRSLRPGLTEQVRVGVKGSAMLELRSGRTTERCLTDVRAKRHPTALLWPSDRQRGILATKQVRLESERLTRVFLKLIISSL
jgi:hypothetical protein